MKLDLADLLVEDIEVMRLAPELALESLSAGQAMIETGGSSISVGIVLCSCCCCC
ncbi:hypothetical protein Rhe02_34370 [Rhizocola hellebori]|uniref:Uncharacterized protein n=1 Tax=Rhizocola hellebori TaxID=1392758 RepID=A0A8J3Q7Q0_9ACTN|nr:hypothetical protein [Rhizocola hellebori]GIH05370.1 hypothetical protein Rhe02_34370 [Rhizocola hellebori]